MQFLRIAAVLSLVAAVGTVRAEWFSINNAISQAVLTNPGVGEASANRRATEAELRQTST
jgi:adhesin transport system outer membrane protein